MRYFRHLRFKKMQLETVAKPWKLRVLLRSKFCNNMEMVNKSWFWTLGLFLQVWIHAQVIHRSGCYAELVMAKRLCYIFGNGLGEIFGLSVICLLSSIAFAVVGCKCVIRWYSGSTSTWILPAFFCRLALLRSKSTDLQKEGRECSTCGELIATYCDNNTWKTYIKLQQQLSIECFTKLFY